jgi:hypothetical protein
MRAFRSAAVLAVAVSALVVIGRVDDSSREAWTSQASQVDEALDARYVEPISYNRAYVPADRGVRTATETIIVDGVHRPDCTAEVVEDDETVVDARLVCQSPIVLTAEAPSTS